MRLSAPAPDLPGPSGGKLQGAGSGLPSGQQQQQAPLTKRKLHELEREIAKPKGKWTVSSKTPGPTTVAKAAAAAAGATAMADDDAVPALKAASVGDVIGLSRRLLALLFDCWAECGPSKAVGGTPDLEGLQVTGAEAGSGSGSRSNC